MSLIVPPGGFAGFAQQTPATQLLFNKRAKKASPVRRKRKAKTTAKKKPVRRASAKRKAAPKRGNKFVKGSAAAKRHMARLRAMRKR